MKPHKHRDAIIAWANGFPIEMRKPGKNLWVDCAVPPLWIEEWEYRIKNLSPANPKDQQDLKIFK